MKKIALLSVLLVLVGFRHGMSQQTNVVDLAGEYVCLTQGAPASLQFNAYGQVAEITFCPDAQPENCVTYIELHPTLVEGKILSKGPEPGSPPSDWPDTRFVVDETQGKVRITVYFSNGIDYLFERQ